MGKIKTESFGLGPSNLVYILRMTPIAFQCQRSGQMQHTLLLLRILVNKIKTELVGLGSSNLIHVLVVARQRRPKKMCVSYNPTDPDLNP